MANMQGFDLILEISPNALVELIRPHLVWNGVNYDPPAEIESDIPMLGGRVHFVITDLNVSVGENTSVSIIFSFERGSAIGRPGRPDLTNLSGTITISSRVILEQEPMDPTRRKMTLQLNTASVRARVPAAREVEGILAGGLTHILSGIRTNPGISLPFQVDPRSRASINPPVFHDLRLDSVSGAGGRQALVLFANLLPGATSRGNTELWNTSTLSSGDDVSLLISPQLFHELIFKPLIQARLGVSDPDLLPATCGRAESVPFPSRPEVSITRVTDTMREGRIDIEIRARQRAGDDGDPLGHTDLIEIHSSLTMMVRPPNQIIPQFRTESVSGGTHFGYGWWLLGLLALPLYGLMGARAVLADMFSRSLPVDLSSGTISIPDLMPLRLLAADISADHLRLSGVVNRSPRRRAAPTLHLDPLIVTESRERIAEGLYESTECPEGVYEWQRWRQRQYVKITPSTSLASHPVRHSWQILTAGGGAAEVLDGSSPVEREAECFMADTIPSRRVRQNVQITYGIASDGVITLQNRPDDGMYHVTLICTAIDAAGNRMEQSIHFDFNGMQTVMGSRIDFEAGPVGSWERDYALCVERAMSGAAGMRGMKMAGGRMLDQASIPHWILAHRPPPWDMSSFIHAVSQIKNPKKAQLMLEHAVTLYGPSILNYIETNADFLNVVTPPEEIINIKQPDLVKQE